MREVRPPINFNLMAVPSASLSTNRLTEGPASAFAERANRTSRGYSRREVPLREVRPPATILSRRGRNIVLNVNPREFTFLFLHYPSVRIGDAKKLASVNTDDPSRRNIVYFNRALDYGSRLILKVQTINRQSEAHHGFILGFTTCDMNKIHRFSSHFGGYCTDEKPCKGNSLYIKIKSVDVRGTCIVIERDPLSFMKVSLKSV